MPECGWCGSRVHGAVASTPKKLHQGHAHRTQAYEAKKQRLKSEQLPEPELESSYDWLDQGLLGELKLGHLNVRPSQGIQWNLPKGRFYQLRRAFKRFFDPFLGVSVPGNSDAIITYRIEEPHRWDTSQNVCRPNTLIFGVAQHTGLPVAMSFDYNFFGGQLVLMPPFENQSSPSEARVLAIDLRDLGEWILATTRERPADRQVWAKEYLAPRAIAIEEEIATLEQRILELAPQTEPYYQMLSLLDGTGSELEAVLLRLFDSPDEGISVTMSEPGGFIDMLVQESSGRTLAMEATGVKGGLRHNDPHWADFLNYIPEHNARNEGGRIERIVLVVNTFRELPPAERDHTSDMTGPVIKTATDNGICVVRSADLYELWLQTLDGTTVQEVFDTLFMTEGVVDLHQ